MTKGQRDVSTLRWPMQFLFLLSAAALGCGNGAERDASPAGFAVDEATLERAAVGLLSCTSDDGFYRTLVYLRGAQAGYSYPGGAEFFECLSEVTTGCAGVIRCLDEAGEPTEEPCEWASFEEHCDARGRPTMCDDFVWSGPVCADVGLECSTASGDPTCRGTGADCSGGGSSYFQIAMDGTRCRGPVLEGCFHGGLDEIDCGNLGPGFTCQNSGDAIFCGTATECDPATFGYECDGEEAVFCNAGKIRRVDCTSLGFDECSSDPQRVCE